LVAPLQELAGDGTRIPLTPHDVAQLGQSGAAVVLAAAPERLAGVDGQDARTAVLRELIDTAIAERRNASPPPTVDGAVDMQPPTPAAALPPSAAPDDLGGDSAHREDLNLPAAEADRVGEKPPTAATDSARTVTSATAPATATTAACVDARQIRAALDVLRDVDPAAAARALGRIDTAVVARDCVQTAQRLARLGQLLKLR
jgi:hypothetical protein